MNIEKKRFQINRICHRINDARTVVWFHRNPMNAQDKQTLIRGLRRFDSQAQFVWIKSGLGKKIVEQFDSPDLKYLPRISQGPSAIILFFGVCPFPFWKWIQTQNTLVILGAQIGSQSTMNSEKLWYTSQEVQRLATLRPNQVYSNLLSVLQIPRYISDLLRESVAKRTDLD